MDSEHRHELKDNDLYEFILGFKDFWAKWGNEITWTFLILASLFAGVRLYNYYTFQQHEDAWSDLAQSSASADGSPDVLTMIAQEYSDPAVTALAYLSAGDLRLSQALKDEPEDAAAAEKAASDYRKVLQVATGDEQLLFRLNARLGLAAALEQQAQWDAAKEQYQKVIDEAAARYPHLAQVAQANLAMHPTVQSPVVFGPEPPKAPASGSGDGLGDLGDLGIGNLDDLLAPDPNAPDPTTGLPGSLDFSPSSDNDPILPDLPQGVGSLDLSPEAPSQPVPDPTPDSPNPDPNANP